MGIVHPFDGQDGYVFGGNDGTLLKRCLGTEFNLVCLDATDNDWHETKYTLWSHAIIYTMGRWWFLEDSWLNGGYERRLGIKFGTCYT